MGMGPERVTGSQEALRAMRESDAAIAARIDNTIAKADFSSAPLPDFTAVSPNPQRVLADLTARAQLDANPSDRLRDAVSRLGQALDRER